MQLHFAVKWIWLLQFLSCILKTLSHHSHYLLYCPGTTIYGHHPSLPDAVRQGCITPFYVIPLWIIDCVLSLSAMQFTWLPAGLRAGVGNLHRCQQVAAGQQIQNGEAWAKRQGDDLPGYALAGISTAAATAHINN